MKPIRNIAFVANLKKTGAKSLAESLAKIVQKQGGTADICLKNTIPKKFLANRDACCVIGGDGTLLSVVQQSLQYQTPVFGVNQGKLGFLATFSPEEAIEKFSNLLEGHYNTTHRFILLCQSEGHGEHMALNDVVLKHTNSSHLVTIEVYCNQEFVTIYSGDGLIFSTPTGSTAYNLSAGGPIICPGAKVFAMTPICAHTLSNRTVIFDHNSRIKAVCADPDMLIQVTLDGHNNFTVQPNAPIRIEIPEMTLPLLQPRDYSHFRILRNKLKWGE